MAQLNIKERQAGDVTILDLSGKVTIGEGSVQLREVVKRLLEEGKKKILLNLGDVSYVDSSGIGELVSSYTTTNNAGGLEGGVTNGQPVVVRAAMKPLSTLRTPLKSVDLATKEAVEAVVERSDVCAVPAAGIVGEAMMAIVLADAFLEKFGGDGLEEVRRNYRAYQDSLRGW